MENIEKIIESFIEKKIKTEEVEGVLLFGSALSGRFAVNSSDIDLIVALNTKKNKLSVGVSLVEGVRVEYFIYNIGDMYPLALKELDKNDLSHLTKFVTSKVIFDKTGQFEKIINKIRKLYEIEIKEDHSDFTKKALFHINNRIEDLYSLKKNNSFYIVYFDVLNKIRELHTKANGLMILPLMKSEKLFKDEMYMKEYIKSDIHKGPEKEFMKRYLECLKIKSKTKMIKQIKEIFNYCFKKENFNLEDFVLEFNIESGIGI